MLIVLRLVEDCILFLKFRNSSETVGTSNCLKDDLQCFFFVLALKNELIDALKNEITAEKQLEKENLRGEQAPRISGFEITTDGANVQLAKLHGKEK